MTAEKIIKLQAKKHLEGNFTVIIAQVMLVLLAFITVLCAGELAASAAGIDTSSALSGGQTAAYMVICAVQAALTVLLLPLVNGVCRSACTAARGGECRARDMLYYFQNGFGLFLKTLIVDVVSVGLFTVCCVLLNVSFYISLIYEVWRSYSDAAVLLGLVWPLAVIASIFEIIAFYIIFIHYTFSAYGFNDGLPVGVYLGRMYGFALKNFGRVLKLILSFAGWFLLCFFVLPAFYVVPYYLTASAMSARWTFETDPLLKGMLFNPERRNSPC